MSSFSERYKINPKKIIQIEEIDRESEPGYEMFYINITIDLRLPIIILNQI